MILSPFKLLKRILPQNLFGRALLILVVPTVMVQLVAAYIFFERHWDTVNRHMSISLAGEIAFLVHEMNDASPVRRQEVYTLADGLMGIRMSMQPAEEAPFPPNDQDAFPEFSRQLQSRLPLPFAVVTDHSDDLINIYIQHPDGRLMLQVSEKRLISGTTTIFITWMVGAAVLFLLIAILFLRNQIRPITQLAEAAENFGRGMELGDFRPRGAREVRRAGRAFMVMRERIHRQVTARTDMLSSISHDLRTPLTRMKLALSMMGGAGDVKALQGDVVEMEHMVNEYLDFARGMGREESQEISLRSFMDEIMFNYERQGEKVSLHMPGDRRTFLRPQAFKRALTNIIDNGLRYGKRCHLHVLFHADYLALWIDDEGPGIPAAERDRVFRAFTRLDESRNLQTGGVGLGLTIARDIILGHGGEISLQEVPEGMGYQAGGLRVRIMMPL